MNNKKQQSFSDYPEDNIAKTLFGKMNKLSNKGWTYHLRLVKMDQNSISYYRNVPKDFDGNQSKYYN